MFKVHPSWFKYPGSQSDITDIKKVYKTNVSLIKSFPPDSQKNIINGIFHLITIKYYCVKHVPFKEHKKTLLCSSLTFQKIAIWLSKNCPKLDIFSKNIAKNFLLFFLIEKKKLKKMSSFSQFLTFKGQFSGGSGL